VFVGPSPGLSDASGDTRIAVFSSLSPALDPFLASPVNVDVLVLASRDEAFEVKAGEGWIWGW
jgi:hypothetical protein